MWPFICNIKLKFEFGGCFEKFDEGFKKRFLLKKKCLIAYCI